MESQFANCDLGKIFGEQYALEPFVDALDERIKCAHMASESLRKAMFRHPVTRKLHIEPAHENEARYGPDAEIWERSMEDEISSMVKFEVWTGLLEEELPKGAKLSWVINGSIRPRSIKTVLLRSSNHVSSVWDMLRRSIYIMILTTLTLQ